MAALIISLFRLIRLLGRGHEAIALENAALRLQLAPYRRDRIVASVESPSVRRAAGYSRWQRERFWILGQLSSAKQLVAADRRSEPKYVASYSRWRTQTHSGARH